MQAYRITSLSPSTTNSASNPAPGTTTITIQQQGDPNNLQQATIAPATLPTDLSDYNQATRIRIQVRNPVTGQIEERDGILVRRENQAFAPVSDLPDSFMAAPNSPSNPEGNTTQPAPRPGNSY